MPILDCPFLPHIWKMVAWIILSVGEGRGGTDTLSHMILRINTHTF